MKLKDKLKHYLQVYRVRRLTHESARALYKAAKYGLRITYPYKVIKSTSKAENLMRIRRKEFTHMAELHEQKAALYRSLAELTIDTDNEKK